MALSSRTVIPRFLLPLQSPLWRGVVRSPSRSQITTTTANTIRARHASSSSSSSSSGSSGSADKDKPIVLARPDRFNPPSHGSRLSKGGAGLGRGRGPVAAPRHYGPTLTAEEVAQQDTRHYPGLMAPKGTWAYWVWHSKTLHTVITLGALLAMGVFTFFMNYAYNSPFRDQLPPASSFWRSPLASLAQWRDVILMHEHDKSARARERRFSSVDDAAKRKYYMKMHGIETKNPVHIVFGKPQESEAELEAAALGLEPPPKPERKKWFGIF